MTFLRMLIAVCFAASLFIAMPASAAASTNDHTTAEVKSTLGERSAGGPLSSPTQPAQDRGALQAASLFEQSCVRFAGHPDLLRAWIGDHHLQQLPPEQALGFSAGYSALVFGASTHDGKMALVSQDNGACRVVVEFGVPANVEDALTSILRQNGVTVSPVGTHADPQNKSIQQMYTASIASRHWLFLITSRHWLLSVTSRHMHPEVPEAQPEIILLATVDNGRPASERSTSDHHYYKLGPVTLDVPEGYVSDYHPASASDPSELTIRALLPDLKPRPSEHAQIAEDPHFREQQILAFITYPSRRLTGEQLVQHYQQFINNDSPVEHDGIFDVYTMKSAFKLTTLYTNPTKGLPYSFTCRVDPGGRWSLPNPTCDVGDPLNTNILKADEKGQYPFTVDYYLPKTFVHDLPDIDARLRALIYSFEVSKTAAP